MRFLRARGPASNAAFSAVCSRIGSGRQPRLEMHRLAIVASHPIQYQAPWFRALARVTDLTVLFCHQQQPADQARAGFGVAFDWDVPLLDGYRHEWLHNRASTPDVSRATGC